MAAFWDKIKSFFGGGGAGDPGADVTLRGAINDLIAARSTFRVDEVLDAAGVGEARRGRVVVLLAESHRDGALALQDYQRTYFPAPFDLFVYHHKSSDPADWLAQVTGNPAARGAAAAGGAPAARSQQQQQPPAVTVGPPVKFTVVITKERYAAGEILGLSKEELRKRALKIDPYKTDWIGRVDTIPPQSDERTALIDRGLVLRGFLTPEQLAEIHRVGDLWLKHHDAMRLASIAAARTAQEIVEAERKKRAEKKEQKKREAAERAEKHVADVARRKAEDIVFLGHGVSAGLVDRRSDNERLRAQELPLLSSPADVARALELPIPRLRWLCYHAEAAERTHYVYFEIPKRSGGTRLLAAPHQTLAKAQQWILANILERLPTEDPAHGFIRGRSTVTSARQHLGRDVVVNLDLSDFFPTITLPRVRGVFEKLGYSPAVATVLALLCTAPPRRPVEFDGRRYWVAVGDRALPQGACTSPALSNQVALRLDRRLAGMSRRHGLVYTRYADDLTLSAGPGKREEVPMMIARVRHIVEDEGFLINEKKGRVQRSAGRQMVTGIVVNARPGVPREEVRRLRAILHAAQKTGLAAQNREARPDFEAHIRGKIAYVNMVDPIKGAQLLRAFEALSPG